MNPSIKQKEMKRKERCRNHIETPIPIGLMKREEKIPQKPKDKLLSNINIRRRIYLTETLNEMFNM